MAELDDHERAATMLRRTGPSLGSCATGYGTVSPMPSYDPAADTRPAVPVQRVRHEPTLGERQYEAWIGGL